MKYKLDPFSLEQYEEEELVDILNDITDKAETFVEDNSVELAQKTVTLSDAQVVVIELLSRAEEIYDDFKLDAQSKQADKTREFREQWELEHPGVTKFPASTYFDDLALSATRDEWKKANGALRKVKRLKMIRENYETKINATKKLLGALEMINY